MFPRHIRDDVLAALQDTRVVVVLGARQVGKSTLVESIAAAEHPARVLTFDDQATREGAARDPTGFVANIATPVVIDEVQRVPDVLLAIKQRVDADPRPGQFLLTGSANVLTAPRIADALTGRAEYLRLAPLSQGEIRSFREGFMTALFEGRAPAVASEVGRRPYAHLIAAGGFPLARERSGKRRLRFFESYVETVIQRDLSSVAKVHDQQNVRRLLSAFAATSSTLLNSNMLARELAVNLRTIQSHTAVLETLFLVALVPPYSGNLLSRAVKTPKGYISDSGLLAYLIGADEDRIVADDTIAGMMFETFAVMELLRQSTWQESPLRAFHYRDRDGREVDLVLERPDGSIAGVEVKAAASVSHRDFAGLRHLRAKLGGRFRAGVLLYSGPNTVPVGDRLFAVPLSGLWR